ncbi:MAG: GNAT family N-acetyltransferase [Firmicutes bacterium]|nr:GNAT family N-acetyltransferase [Bacillota bacterium]
MTKLELKTLLKKADKNLLESIIQRITSSKNGKLYKTDSYIVYTIGVDNEDGHLNGVLCFDDNCGKEVLNTANKFFKPMNRNYVIWIRNHADKNLEKILLKEGYKPKREPGSSGMVIKEKIKSVKIPKGFEVKEVKSSKEINDFSLVIKNSFNKPSIVSREMVNGEEILTSSNTKTFIIYEKNIPVAAASMVISDTVAGIYWVGTIKEKRGLGLGSYITKVATNAGFDSGAKRVILQASEAGERVYKKLGYETITHYKCYPITV